MIFHKESSSKWYQNVIKWLSLSTAVQQMSVLKHSRNNIAHWHCFSSVNVNHTTHCVSSHVLWWDEHKYCVRLLNWGRQLNRHQITWYIQRTGSISIGAHRNTWFITGALAATQKYTDTTGAYTNWADTFSTWFDYIVPSISNLRWDVMAHSVVCPSHTLTCKLDPGFES